MRNSCARFGEAVKVDIIMSFKGCALCFVVFGVALAAEKRCVTPNGENGSCIPVNLCRPIKQAISYFDQDAIQFAKASQCGFEGAPLVCCGSVGRVTNLRAPTTTLPLPTTPPPPATPINHILLPDRSLCGLHITENNRGPTGKVTESTEFPWMVALKYTKHDGTPGGFRCSGTLINQRYVLSAAHCLDMPGFNLTEARLGEWRFSTVECVANFATSCADSVVDLMVTEKISHPYYNNRSGNYDIALIRLERDVGYNDYIRPICLPPSYYPAPPAGTQMETSGWHITRNGAQSDVKLKATVSMVGSEDCDRIYPNYSRVYPNRACAGGKIDDNLCGADPGSPLMRAYEQQDETDEEQWFQEGIVHKVAECEGKSYVALYTRVSRYLHWIFNNLK